MEDAIMVKCKDCGYLGVRHIESQTLVSPGENQRESGAPALEVLTYPPGTVRFTNDLPPTRVIVDGTPVCAVGAVDLYAECESIQQPGRNQAAKSVMQDDRDCKQFTTRIPGLTPKEHVVRNLIEKWEQTQDRKERKNTRINVGLLLAGILAAIAAWWSATHPAIVFIPQTSQSPAVTAPVNPAKAK
jgi:hypothetical protein